MAPRCVKANGAWTAPLAKTVDGQKISAAPAPKNFSCENQVCNRLRRTWKEIPMLPFLSHRENCTFKSNEGEVCVVCFCVPVCVFVWSLHSRIGYGCIWAEENFSLILCEMKTRSITYNYHYNWLTQKRLMKKTIPSIFYLPIDN